MFRTCLFEKRWDELKNVNRIVLYIIIGLLLLLFAFWGLSFAQCERLTKLYGHMFNESYRQHTMLEDIAYHKVLYYSENTAKVYYVTTGKGSGHILTFSKSEIHDEWAFVNWDTVWSTSGSADGFVWPYIR